MPPRERQDPGPAPGWSLDATRTSDRARRSCGRAASSTLLPWPTCTGSSSVPPTGLERTGNGGRRPVGGHVPRRGDARRPRHRSAGVARGGGDLQLTGVSAWTMRIIEICGLRDDARALSNGSGVDEHLDGPVELLLELVVRLGCVGQRDAVRRETLDAQRIVVGQQRQDLRHPPLHVRLTHP